MALEYRQSNATQGWEILSGEKNPLKWPLLIAGIGCLVPLLIVVGACVWFLPKYLRPIPKPPTVKMPKPNAYDYYLAAAKTIQNPDELWHAPLPPAQGAKSRKIEALVRKNSVALKLLRQGLKGQYHQPSERGHYRRIEDAHFPTLARLLVAEGRARSGSGDWGGAVSSYLDAMQMGQQIARGGGLHARRESSALQNYARYQMWGIVDRLDGKDCLAAAQRLQGQLSLHVAFNESLKEERWEYIAFEHEFSRQLGSIMASQLKKNPSMQNPRPAAWFARQYLLQSQRNRIRKYFREMEPIIVQSRSPYATRPFLDVPRGESEFGDINEGRFQDTSCQAQNVLLICALALRAYRLQHGTYPNSLEDLAPALLAAVPADPFTLGKLQGYKRSGHSYVLYSAGPDLNDDAGKPIYAWPGGRYQPRATSKGDIVAGVNTR